MIERNTEGESPEDDSHTVDRESDGNITVPNSTPLHENVRPMRDRRVAAVTKALDVFSAGAERLSAGRSWHAVWRRQRMSERETQVDSLAVAFQREIRKALEDGRRKWEQRSTRHGEK